MVSHSSTLSSHSVVLSWLKDRGDKKFPMDDFTKSISHDLQGSQVLLSHIGNLKPVWTHSLPSVHRSRHQLYIVELRPRLDKDVKRVERLIKFVDAEVEVFCHRPSPFSRRDNSITVALLNQLLMALRHLVSQIDSLPPKGKDLDSAPERTSHCMQFTKPDEQISRKKSHRNGMLFARKIPKPQQTSPQKTVPKPITESIIPQPNADPKVAAKKRVHFAGLQANQVALIKPHQAPTLVTNFSGKLSPVPSPVERVDSAMSIR